MKTGGPRNYEWKYKIFVIHINIDLLMSINYCSAWAWVKVKLLVLRFGPKINTKVAIGTSTTNPPDTTF